MKKQTCLLSLLAAGALACLAIGQQSASKAPRLSQADYETTSTGQRVIPATEPGTNNGARNSWWTNAAPEWWNREFPSNTNRPPNWWTNVPGRYWTNVPTEWWTNMPPQWWTNVPSHHWQDISPAWWSNMPPSWTNRPATSFRLRSNPEDFK